MDAGLQGFECLSGIPGSTGATPIQNVGAYGQEVSETSSRCACSTARAARSRRSPAAECGFRYRTSRSSTTSAASCSPSPSRCARAASPARCATPSWRARLDRPVGGSAPLAEVREAVLELRRGKGMVIDPADPDSVSAGSFFTNPILAPEAYAALEARLGADRRPPALAGARRPDQDLGRVADRARRLPARLRRRARRDLRPSTRWRS